MKVTETGFKGLKVIETDLYGDHRGWFTESYTKKKFDDNGIQIDFIQDNHSFSSQKGTLRGIHFQTNPKSQTKMIRCIKGAIIDTAVDLRKGSDTYKQWFSIELSAENKKQLLIPKGFGHAYLTICDDVEVQYKVDEYYVQENDRSIRFDDPEIGVEWRIKNPILSKKDLHAPFLKDSDVDFSIKVLVTGVKGQLGYDVVRRLNKLKIDNLGVDIDDFDITDKRESEKFILDYNPDVIVHCAAYTAVDRAEDEKEKCYAVNVEGTRNIAEVCFKIDAKMIYISTDYVFNGKGEKPYTEEEKTDPVNYYGYTKEQGEKIVRDLLKKHFIVRTSWVYGINGTNFLKTIIKLAESREYVKVVNDQIGTPTYTSDLAELVCDMLQTNKYGTYHGVNEGYISWFDFTHEIFKEAGMDTKVKPISTSQYPTKAQRPLNSRLSNLKLEENGFNKLSDWKDALKRYLLEYRNHGDKK
jgi:dTDP-4-dehydrorhamnose reductase/dTDP-4-dehydrorhamnose 3,5-epimerase